MYTEKKGIKESMCNRVRWYLYAAQKFGSLTINQMSETFYTNLTWFARDAENSDN